MIIGVYAGAIILLNIPYFQHKTTVLITEILQDRLKTEISIGKVDFGFFNRLIIEDVNMKDQNGRPMLQAARLAAKIELIPLLKKKINIRSIQFFGFNIHLNKKTPDDKLNCQFVIDALKNKNPKKKKTPLDLRINSVLIRRGNFSYDIFSKPYKPGKLDISHLHFSNLMATINLKVLTDDSINLTVRRMNLQEQSGLNIKRLALRLEANKKIACINGLTLHLPHSKLVFGTIYARYKNMKNAKEWKDKCFFSTRINSKITLADLTCITSILGKLKHPLQVQAKIDGYVNRLRINHLRINGNKNSVQFNGDIQINNITHIQQTYFEGRINNLYVNPPGMNFIAEFLNSKQDKTLNTIKQVGAMVFRGKVKGNIHDITIIGRFNTDIGNVETRVRYKNDIRHQIKYLVGQVHAFHLNAGKLIKKGNLLGYTDFNLKVDATLRHHSKPTILAKGLISNLEYSHYNYRNIKLDGKYDRGDFDGKFFMNDANGMIHIDGNFNIEGATPLFNLTASMKNFKPYNLHLTSSNKFKESEISMGIQANFTGHSIDDAIGEIKVDTLNLKMLKNIYSLHNLSIRAQKEGNAKRLELLSSEIDAAVVGNYSYRTIPSSILQIVERYIPSLIKLKKIHVETHNNFKFNANLKRTDFLNKVLNVPLTLDRSASFSGYFNDNNKKIEILGDFPQIHYANLSITHGRLVCENLQDTLKCQLRGTTRMKNGSSLNLLLYANAKNDRITTSLNWGNNTALTYSGEIAAVTNFIQSPHNLKANINIKPTDVILGDSIWHIYHSQINVDSGQVAVHNFLFKHRDQFIKMEGMASKNPHDTLKIKLNKVDLAYLFGIINFKSVDFGGIVSGDATISKTITSPEFNANLDVKNFTFNNGFLGDAQIFGKWDKDQEGFFLKASIHEGDVSQSQVQGYIWIKKKMLSLDIQAHHTPVKFIETYVDSITSNIDGRATGSFRVFGGFKSLNVTGKGMFDGSFKVNILNTYFALHDSVTLTENEIAINNALIEDREGHKGTATASVYHHNFKGWNYRLQVNASNMLVYNTTETNDLSFYGKIYGTGNVVLTGNTNELNINAALTSNPKTVFVYRMQQAASIVNNQFIHFVDKTPQRPQYDSIFNNEQDIAKQEKRSSMNVHMTISIDALPNATMRIIVDPRAGDNIECNGNGNLRLDYYNKGEMKIFGTYTVSHGVYKFSLQQVIRKNFDLRQGSTITFSGDPMNANLDLHAAYTVSNVSLSNLLGTDLASTLKTSSNIRVNCIMNISGAMQNPAVKFGLELPSEDEEVQRIVRSYVSTDDQMNMQILYLLSVGKFYTSEYAQSTQTSSTSNNMTSMLSSTLSGQFNDIISQLANSQNWNFGFNGSTGDSGWTDVELEGILSGRLLNNRLLINGNFGYRDNTNSTTQTNFIGDFDFQWILTKNGDISLKAYNKANDRYSTKTSLNTQGIGIIFKKDFDSWRDILPWIDKKEKIR